MAAAEEHTLVSIWETKDKLDKLVGTVKSALYFYTLARLKELQESVDADEAKFTEEQKKKDTPWDTFDNLLVELAEDEKKKKIARPVNMRADAAAAVAVPFAVICSLIRKMGKLGVANPLKKMSEFEAPEAEVVKTLVTITTKMKEHISNANTMGVGRGYKESLLVSLVATVTHKTAVDPGGDVVVNLFLDFIRCMAWNIGNTVWENKDGTKCLTFNFELAVRLIANMKMLVPGTGVADMLRVIREQHYEYDELKKKEKAPPKPKSAGKKAGAAKAGGGAAVKTAPKAAAGAKAAPAAKAAAGAKAAPKVTAAKAAAKPTAAAKVAAKAPPKAATKAPAKAPAKAAAKAKAAPEPAPEEEAAGEEEAAEEAPAEDAVAEEEAPAEDAAAEEEAPAEDAAEEEAPAE